MKKHRPIIIITTVVAVAVIVVAAIAIYALINRERLIFEYMLYEHIHYNGNDYYTIDSRLRPSGEGVSSDKREPVHLVFGSSRFVYENYNHAFVYTGYGGEEDEIYLFFVSADCMRKDYLDAIYAGR